MLCIPLLLRAASQARQGSLPGTSGAASGNQALSHCQWDYTLLVKGTTKSEPRSSFFFVFSVTHSETCGELFGINYFSSILQSQNALSGIFFFKQPWGLVSTLKMLQTVWAEWKRRTPCLSGYRPRVSIRNSCVCKFSSLMHLLTFLWCCHC